MTANKSIPQASLTILPSPPVYTKGTQFADKRNQVWTLVSGNAEGATLNRETEGGCISSRLTWEEIDRRFSLISPPPDAPPTLRTDSTGQKNTRRRKRTSGNRNPGIVSSGEVHAGRDSADVLLPESRQASEAGRQQTGVSLDSPLEPFEYGDRIRARNNRTGEWEVGFATRLGRTYAELDNKRCFVLLEGAELLQRGLLPDDLLEIVGKCWEDQVDHLLEDFRFYNLSSWHSAKRSERVVDRHQGWEVSFYNGSEVDITKGDRTWYAELKRFPELKNNGDICAYARKAIDHVEQQLSRLEELTTAASRIDSQLPLEPKFQIGDRVAATYIPGEEWQGADLSGKLFRFQDGDLGTIESQDGDRCYTVRFDHGNSLKFFGRQLRAIADAPIPIHAEATQDAIARLEMERDAVRAEGAIAPDGCWIETGKVKSKDFRQAWWRSTRPTFQSRRSRGNVEALVKSCYIGKEGSPEHKEAMAQKERRDRLRTIERQIQILMEEA